MKIKFNFILLIFLLIPFQAYAYIGPGFGGGILLATLGIVVAIFATIFGLVWFPLKKIFTMKKKKKNNKIE